MDMKWHTLALCALLGLGGCGDDGGDEAESETSASTTTASGSTTDPSTSTGSSTGSSSTTDPGTTTGTSTSSGGSTGGSGGTTTGFNPDDAYHPCGPNGPACEDGDLCLIIVPGQLPGTCAPPCQGNNDCADPLEGDAEPVCNIDEDGDGNTEFCNLGCSFDSTACPTGMECTLVSSGASMCLWPPV